MNSRQCCRNCRAENAAAQHGFCEYTLTMRLGTDPLYSGVFPTMDAKTVTAFVRNAGGGPVVAYIQNSPNGCDFLDDPQRLELAGGQMGYLVPYIFSKYMRVVLTGPPGGSARLYFQMQNMR